MFLAGDVQERAPSDDFWYYPVGGLRTMAGVRVSPSTALAVGAVFACVQILGQTVAVVPLQLYERLDRGKKLADNHPLYRLLHRRPNRWQTSFQFRQMMQWHLALRGNSYAEIFADRRGTITELVPLPPDNVKPEAIRGADGMTTLRYRINDARGERVLVRGEIVHLRALASDGLLGLSPLDVARETVGEAIAAQAHSSRMLQNDARPPGIIEWEGHFKDNDALRDFRASWQEAQTGENRGRTAVLQKGMKYKEVGLKASDLQLIELRKMKGYDIAGIFRMPPHKIGIMDRATFSNIEHQGIEFVTDTMLPWYVNWEQELSEQLLLPDERDGFFFEHNVDGLLRGDAKARSEYYSNGVQNGWLTRNEVRLTENLNPLPGLDKPLEPMNMRRAGAKPSPDQAPADDGQDANARLVELERLAAERSVRKELAALRSATGPSGAKRVEEFYGKHVDYLVQTLACSRELAATWCDVRARELLETDDLPTTFAAWEQLGARDLMALLKTDRKENR
jgi:HK97 family phage portal protein